MTSPTLTIPTRAYAARDAKTPLAPFEFKRREPGPNDVHIDILYCGVCHSDIHMVRSEWGPANYPLVPGHEIVGRVTKVGNKVSNFKVGDLAGVGCMVDSCRTCPSCKESLEQFCQNGFTGTYGSLERGSQNVTQGGYSDKITVDEAFVLKIPKNLDLKAVAPLLCAGITTYSPLKHWKIGKGHRVGIIGLGGLGHMGVKFARAFGAHVVLFTTSESKRADGLKLGAHEVVLSKSPEAMAKQAGQLDFILNTVSANMEMGAYMNCLKRDGTLVFVGAPEKPVEMAAFNLIMGRKAVAGSLIGGIRETQEMLDYCGEHGIVSEIEMIKIQDINTAYTRMIKSDVKYRFVIDTASLKPN